MVNSVDSFSAVGDLIDKPCAVLIKFNLRLFFVREFRPVKVANRVILNAVVVSSIPVLVFHVFRVLAHQLIKVLIRVKPKLLLRSVVPVKCN